MGAAGMADMMRTLQGMGASGGAASGTGGLADLLGGMGGGAGLGGAGGQAGMADMMARMLEDNPAMRDNMVSMLSQPGMLEMMAASNPQINQMLNSMPGMRDMMQNPELMRMMLSPDMLRMASQLGSSMVSAGWMGQQGQSSTQQGLGDPRTPLPAIGSGTAWLG